MDGVDEGGSTALHEAAYYGRARSVRHLLLAHGADPTLRDTVHDGTPLDWCRHHQPNVGESGAQDEVEAILAALRSRDLALVRGCKNVLGCAYAPAQGGDRRAPG